MKRSNLIAGLTALGVVAVAIPTFAFNGNLNNGNMNPNQNGFRSQPTEEQIAEREAHREAMDTAFETNNYEAFVELVTQGGRGGRILEDITAENFSRFAEMHTAMRSGDTETAETIRAELGLPERPKMGQGQGRGMHKGQRGGQGNCACPNNSQ